MHTTDSTLSPARGHTYLFVDALAFERVAQAQHAGRYSGSLCGACVVPGPHALIHPSAVAGISACNAHGGAQRLYSPRTHSPNADRKGSSRARESWCCMASRPVTSGASSAAEDASAHSSTASSSRATTGGGTALCTNMQVGEKQSSKELRTNYTMHTL